MKIEPETSADIVIVGAGAAGMMAGIFAGRTNPHRRIILLDSAKKIGAKILVSGGSRCNVTHDEIAIEAYSGASRNAIKKVVRRFDVPQTIGFFHELGVELKREDTGKLFPMTDDARTVLNALMIALRDAGAALLHPYHVSKIEKNQGYFRVIGDWGLIETPRVILATGGKSLPKTGSDGYGYTLAQSLGHHPTARIFPALVPLMLPPDHFICALSGISVIARLELWNAAGKRLTTFTDSILCTHFGLSGPGILDISRYYLDAMYENPFGTKLLINWLPDIPVEMLESALLNAGNQSVLHYLTNSLPERLARALCVATTIEPQTPISQLTRESRRSLMRTLTAFPLPVIGNRGFTYAEVTAGGIPLSEIRLETMESRICAGLSLCGEICDVDGRIGGYNFQWAWSSGYVAGVSV